MIQYNAELKVFHLSTPKTSYVFRIFGEGVLEHLYYGKKLDSVEGMIPCNYGIFVSGAPVDSEYADAESFVSTDIMLQEYGFYGSCDLRTPAFHAAYSDGSRITNKESIQTDAFFVSLSNVMLKLSSSAVNKPQEPAVNWNESDRCLWQIQGG